MSEDEDITFNKKQKTVHYGSLEEQERARLAAIAAAVRGDPGEPVPAGKDLGEIHVSNEYMELEEEVSKDKQALLEEFERRRKARQLNVSTDDGEVRKALRQLAEPVCLFGEGPAERRARLRDLLSFLGEDAIHKRMEEEEARLQQERGQEGTWYHEGPPELRTARLWLARYSLPRARARLRKEAEGRGGAAARQELQRRLATLGPAASQLGGRRPLASCSFSNDSKMLITASWSGEVKVWSVPSCDLLQELGGHSGPAGDAVFRPSAMLPAHLLASTNPALVSEPDSSARELAMASCGHDGSVKLWNFASTDPLAELSGHAPHRVSRVAFHPSGRFLGTCCRDGSWRLWDAEAGQELLHQEGHARAPHDLAFQGDGSVAATGGLDAFGRVWDLRTGRCVMFMEGHLKAVYSVSWSPCGWRLATGSGDNTARVWDLRTRQCLHTIPAHGSLISSVRWQRTQGLYLLTAGYDSTLRLWADRSWQPLNTLRGHDSRIMGLDVAHDDSYVATCSYDRTFKLWAPET